MKFLENIIGTYSIYCTNRTMNRTAKAIISAMFNKKNACKFVLNNAYNLITGEYKSHLKLCVQRLLILFMLVNIVRQCDKEISFE